MSYPGGPTPEQVAAAAGMFAVSAPKPQSASFAPPDMSYSAPDMSYAPPVAPQMAPPPPQFDPAMLERAQSNFGPPPQAAPMPPPPAPVAPPAPAEFVGPPQPIGPPRPPAAPPPASSAPVSPVMPAAAPAATGGMGKLTKRRDADRAQFLGTYDEEQAAVDREAAARMAQNTAVASFQAEQAERQEQDAAIQHQEARQVQDTHAAYLAKTNSMIDDLAREKTDPNRVFHSGDTARDVSFTLGAMLLGGLGGLASGVQGGPNQGIGMLNQIIDRDIAAQDKDLANKRGVIQARDTIYGQMRQAYGDKQAADAAFKAGAIETAKTRLIALTADTSNPVTRAQAEKSLALLEREQAQHMTTFSQQALTLAQQQAAASAAAARTRLDKEREYRLKLAELGIKEVEAGAKLKAAEAARIEAGGKADQHVADKTAEYSGKLETAGLPQAEAEIATLLGKLPKRGEEIPGFSNSARARDFLASGSAGGMGKRVLLSDEERTNQNNVEQLFLAFRKAMTGSGGSAEEMEQIKSAALGARSTQELWGFIAKAEDVVKARKANLQAGYGPAVTKRYDENMSGTVRPEITKFKPNPGLVGVKK